MLQRQDNEEINSIPPTQKSPKKFTEKKREPFSKDGEKTEIKNGERNICLYLIS